jgi:hypothetical protein
MVIIVAFNPSFEDALLIDNNAMLYGLGFGDSEVAFQDPAWIWGIEDFTTQFS